MTSDGTYTIRTGVDDLGTIGEVTKWRGKAHFTGWGKCLIHNLGVNFPGCLNGVFFQELKNAIVCMEEKEVFLHQELHQRGKSKYSYQIFAGTVRKELFKFRNIWNFIHIRRPLELHFNETLDHFGVAALRFRPAEDLFDYSSERNDCFCVPAGNGQAVPEEDSEDEWGDGWGDEYGDDYLEEEGKEAYCSIEYSKVNVNASKFNRGVRRRHDRKRRRMSRTRCHECSCLQIRSSIVRFMAAFLRRRQEIPRFLSMIRRMFKVNYVSWSKLDFQPKRVSKKRTLYRCCHWTESQSGASLSQYGCSTSHGNGNCWEYPDAGKYTQNEFVVILKYTQSFSKSFRFEKEAFKQHLQTLLTWLHFGLC